MALTSSPRKLVIPLASGDGPKSAPSLSGSNLTKRVFYCGVVVEGSENGRRLPDGMCISLKIRLCFLTEFIPEIQDLVLSLGNPLPLEEFSEGIASNQNNTMNEIVSRLNKSFCL